MKNNNLNHCIPIVAHNFLLGLPAQKDLTAHTIYFIKSGEDIQMYVTDANAIPYLIGDGGGGVSPNLQKVLETGSDGSVPTNILLQSISSETSEGGMLSLYPEGFSIGNNAPEGYVGIQYPSGASGSPEGIEILDTKESKGLRYAQDYSAKQITDERSIPDVGTVKELISNQSLINNLSFNYISNAPYPDPLIEASTGEWDSTLREIGNYFIDEDKKHYIFYTGVNGTAGIDSRVGMAISTDEGKTFIKNGLLFDTPAEDPYVIKVDGTYYCYSEESSNNIKTIQLHTSLDLINWDNQGIVLTSGSGEDWDADSVGSPLTYYNEGTFYLYYEGIDAPRRQTGAIGLATSTDGISFIKNENPVAVGSGFNQSKPSYNISNATIDWGSAIIPDDIKVHNGLYYMTVHGMTSPTGTSGARAGMLVSQDLINWQDILETYISKNDGSFEDVMFVNSDTNLEAIYLNLERSAIYKGEFLVNNTGDYQDKNIQTSGTISSTGILEINNKATAIGLPVFENDQSAALGGLEYRGLYINNYNLVTRRKQQFNLFLNSEPTENEGTASNITYESFNWGINDFTTAVRFGGTLGTNKNWYGATLQAGVTYNLSVYVKMDDNSKPVVGFTSAQSNADFSLKIGNIHASLYPVVELISDDIYRVSASFTPTTSLTSNGIIQFAGNSGKAFRATGFQITPNIELEPYSKTPNQDSTTAGNLIFDGNDVVLQSFLDSSNFVYPENFEGTDTERIQQAADYVSQNNSKVVWIGYNEQRGSNVWMIDNAILLDTNTVIYIVDSKLKLSDTSRDNLFRTVNTGIGISEPWLNPKENIHIIGIGSAILEGADNPRSSGDNNKTLSLTSTATPPSGVVYAYGSDAANPSEKQTGDWRNIMVAFCFTDNCSIEGVTVRNAHGYSISFERCTYYDAMRIHLDSPRDRDINGIPQRFPNCDGIKNVMGGSFGRFINITGHTDDNLFTAGILGAGLASPDDVPGNLNTPTVTGQTYMPEYDNIHDIIIENANVYCYNSIFRCLNTMGSEIYNVSLRNITDSSVASELTREITGGFAIFGSFNPDYGGATPMGTCRNISIDNIKMYNSRYGINLQGTLAESTITNFTKAKNNTFPAIYLNPSSGGMRNVEISNIYDRGLTILHSGIYNGLTTPFSGTSTNIVDNTRVFTDNNNIGLNYPSGSTYIYGAKTLVTKEYVDGAISGGGVTIDDMPTSGSPNAVSSGGVFTALGTKQDTLSGNGLPYFTGSSIAWTGSGTSATYIRGDGSSVNFSAAVRGNVSLVGWTPTVGTITAATSIQNALQILAGNTLTGSATLDFPSTAANASSDLTIAVTGASIGDAVSLGSPTPAAASLYTAFVSATNTVTVRFINFSVAAINPTSATFTVKVFK